MYRNVEIVLYDLEILKSKVKILKDNNINYAYILHDKDINDDGEFIKPHYHLRIFHNDKKTISAWSKLLEVANHDIEILDHKVRAIRYLIHLDSPNKYQYSSDEVISSFDLSTYFSNKEDEEGSISYICEYIDSCQHSVTFREVKTFVLLNKFWSVYRRNYSIIRDLIMEHNLLLEKLCK